MIDRAGANRRNLEGIQFDIAICTLNRRGYLERAVDAVLAQLAGFPRGRLIVVDNGSTDGTAGYLAELSQRDSRVHAIHEEQCGHYYGRVRAILSASGEFLIFLDDDAVPQPGWLIGMLRELAAAPEIGVVGAAIDPIWETPKPEWLCDRLMREIPVFDLPKVSREARFPCYPPGISLGIRMNRCAALYADAARRKDYPFGRKGTPAAGSSYQILGGDDTDLCEIYARNGFRVIFNGSFRVWHTVQPERLKPEWYVRKFESEGRLRILMLRMTGRPVVGRHTVVMLAALPPLALLELAAPLLPRRLRLLSRAYRAKCAAAWTELLWGPRLSPLSYEYGGAIFPTNADIGVGSTPM
jgi:glycosyltransferase involved in cell wall biosynthesis